MGKIINGFKLIFWGNGKENMISRELCTRFGRNSIVSEHCKSLKIHKLFFIITLFVYYILAYIVGPTAW